MPRPSSNTAAYLVRRAVPAVIIYGTVLGVPCMLALAALFG
jgi:hypothetical protein